MSKPKKRADQLTNDELAKRLFPKPAIKTMKAIAKKKPKAAPVKGS
jgi:hypothetical protein